MTSGEMKVMVFAVLILGIGFVYTTIMDRQGFTGQAVTSDDDSYAYEDNIISEPEATGGITPYGYDEWPVQVQPSYEGSQSTDQQEEQFISAMVNLDTLNVEATCAELLETPFGEIDGIIETCQHELTEAKQKAQARQNVAA